VVYGILAALGIILGAVYMLHLASCVIWGPLKVPAGAHNGEDDHGHAAAPEHADLSGREMAILIPIALAVVLLGIMPNSVLLPILGPLKAIGPAEIQTVVQSSL
jgi:NADH-quinone oxidoreductase subunit M